MGNTHKNTSKKKSAISFFKTRQGVNTLQSVSARPSVTIVDGNDSGYDYFSQQPTYGISYLHATPLSNDNPSDRQLRGSYIVDEDGAVIRVD